MAKTHIELQIEGMTCNQCARTVNGIIENAGGHDAHVDYLMGEAQFELDDASTIDSIKSKLTKAGYPTLQSNIAEQQSGLSAIEKKFLFTLPFSLVLFSHMLLPNVSWLQNHLVQLILCLPVFGIGLSHFGSSSWHSIKARAINMDILILIGSSSAFIYSILGMIYKPEHGHDYLFFETTSTIITLVLLGYVIEHRAVKKTTEALKSLIHHQPAKAKRLTQNGLNQDLEVVFANEIQVGDLILLNIGDTIPVDGRIEHGTIHADQSMLTGESEPISIGKNEMVLSGSVVVGGGCTYAATDNSVNSTLSQIIKLAKDSRKDKPSIQKLSDRVSSWFVPAIIILSLITFFLNHEWFNVSTTESLLRSIAVLVIACPCAMGLATPTAVSVGLGLANKSGIIVKRASDFEVMNSIKDIVFDKTGTLSANQMSFSFEYSDGVDQQMIGSIIKSLESRSSHPIAQSLSNHFHASPQIELTEFKEIPGIGVSAQSSYGKVELRADETNTSKIILKANGKNLVSISKIESLKSHTKPTIDFLKQRGFNLHVFSGDGATKTEQVAKELGINSFKAEMKPSDKVREMEILIEKQPTAMIGDGINDAPALSMASLGISVGVKNAIASNAASVVVLEDSLKSLVRFLNISESVVRTIRQNLFWAFSYNIIAIPMAMMGYLDPMLAALSMAFSDVVVIGNSLRLRFSLNQKNL